MRSENRIGCLADGKTGNFCFIKKGKVKNMMDKVNEMFEAKDVQASDNEAH